MSDDRITNKMSWGDHIPIIDGQGRKASTKNISCIGARTIFPEEMMGDFDIRTARVNDEAITPEMMKKSFLRELELYIRQKRERSYIKSVIKQAKEVGIIIDESMVSV